MSAEAYRERALRVVRCYTREDGGEDVAQETVIAVLRAEARGQELSPGYVAVAARSRVRNAAEKLAYRRRHEAPLEGGDPGDVTEGFEDAACARVDLAAFLETLKPGERVILAALQAGYSLEEIGARTGVSRETVRRSLLRVKRRAAAELGSG